MREAKVLGVHKNRLYSMSSGVDDIAGFFSSEVSTHTAELKTQLDQGDCGVEITGFSCQLSAKK